MYTVQYFDVTAVRCKKGNWAILFKNEAVPSFTSWYGTN